MADTNPENAGTSTDAKASHFAKAIEEAKAGAQALGKEAQERAGAYREKLHERASGWSEEAKERGEDVKARAFQFATEGKAKASEAIASVGKLVEENSGLIDEKIGSKYGDYARGAARTIQDTAARLDAKDLNELGEDAKEFVREKPALALGMAAAAGYMLARLFRGSKG